MVSQTRCKIIIFFRLHQIKLDLSSDIPVFFCFQHCFTTQKKPACHYLQEATGNQTHFQPSQQHCRRPDNPSTKLASERRPRFGCVSSQVRLRLVPGSLSNRGILTEIINLNPEMVIPPSLPSIIRNTDWSILWNKNDWILHNFERHFSNITNRHSFPFNTDCLPEYQTSPLTKSPPEQSSQNASQQVISTNKKRTLDCSNVLFLRYPADSNCCTRFCRPLPSHSVRVPLLLVCECKVKTLFSLHQTFRQKLSLLIKNMANTYSKEPLFQLFIEAN